MVAPQVVQVYLWHSRKLHNWV